MGTSVSQPSPRKGEEGAAAWKESKNTSELKSSPSSKINGILKAVKLQYRDQAIDVLCDKGVSLVFNILKERTSQEEMIARNPKEIAFMISRESRERVAEQGVNSLFCELAINSAVACIKENPNDPLEAFSEIYLTMIMDYYISRDLPETFGSSGISSPQALQSLKQKLREEFSKILKELKNKDLKIAVESLLERIN